MILLAICGLWLILTQTNGPFDLLLKFKLFLFRNKYLGVFFAQLFECSICLGFHLGYIVGFLSLLLEVNIAFSLIFIIVHMLLWGFIGSFCCMICSLLLDLFTKERE